MTAIQKLMGRVSEGNKPFEDIFPTLTETENDMTNENKTQGLSTGQIAASLGMKDGEVKDVMARISELAAMEPKHKEVQKALSDAQTVIAGKDAATGTCRRICPAATARLSTYEQRKRTRGHPASKRWWRMPSAKVRLTVRQKRNGWRWRRPTSSWPDKTLASIPAREIISKEIANDPPTSATAEATKTAEQMMAEKVSEVVGADFKFRKL